jgi:uncharacterized caspase-like protein
MAANDWAIVVGVTRYPGLNDDLKGPENDAKSFGDWLIDKAGGDVPKEHVTLIVSSAYEHTPMQFTILGRFKAMPSASEIEYALLGPEAVSEGLSRAHHGKKVGRRLYIYLAGHGFELEDDKGSTHVVLCAANATREVAGNSIPGQLWATLYARSGLFDEVFLLMDCCRERFPRAPLRQPPLILFAQPDAKDKWVCAFAAQWSKDTYEKPFGSTTRGIFTTALLRGLRGEASTAKGEVTVASLSDYMMNNMKRLLTEQELADSTIAPEPNILPNIDPSTVIVLVPPTKYRVSIRVGPADAGKTLTIYNGSGTVFQQTLTAGAPVEVSLARGMYVAQIIPPGRVVNIEVPGPEGKGAIHVVDFR